MIDISDVKVGDRVRVSSEIGDEATFTVTRIVGSMLGTPRNIYQSTDWDHIEKLTPPLPTKPGYYLEKFPAGSTIWYRSDVGAQWSRVIGWVPMSDERTPRDLVFLGDRDGNRS